MFRTLRKRTDISVLPRFLRNIICTARTIAVVCFPKGKEKKKNFKAVFYEVFAILKYIIDPVNRIFGSKRKKKEVFESILELFVQN